MGGVRRGRECKRFKQRIQAEYDLKHGIAQRAAPDDATVAVLVRAIDRSNSGEFGLARLADQVRRDDAPRRHLRRRRQALAPAPAANEPPPFGVACYHRTA